MSSFSPSIPPVFDQADGLRRLFTDGSARRTQAMAVVSNPNVADGGLMLERLCSALGEASRKVLVIDAAERSPAPRDLAAVDLAACVEPLSRQVSYLAARGLVMRHVDSRGGAGGLLDAVARAAPQADVLLLHATASDLSRVFAAHSPWRRVASATDGEDALIRPILMADDHPTSVTHAYAAMKWLARRGGLWTCDLMLAVSPRSPRARAIPGQLADCADRFIGALLCQVACVDPDQSATAPAPASLHQLVAAQLDPSRAAPAAALLAPTPTRTRHAFPER
jgi:flagellar biosynthesis protein FlhG